MAKESAEKKKVKRPTALKREIQNEKRRLINKSFMSKLRTSLRRFEESLEQDDQDKVKEKLSGAYSMLDKAVKRGVIKLNAASRKKSRLTARIAVKSA